MIIMITMSLSKENDKEEKEKEINKEEIVKNRYTYVDYTE